MKGHTMRTILAGAAGVALVLALTAAGCGSSVKKVSTPAVTAPTATAPSSPTTKAPSPTTAAPSTTPPTTAPPTTPAPTTPSLTPSQQNAIAAAKQYLSLGSGFSQAGLIGQLDSPDGSGFSVADATFAVSSLNENWDAQAVLAAKAYQATTPLSCSGMVQQLSSPDGSQFTLAQAQYGATAVGICS